jgi:hypothetical protein
MSKDAAIKRFCSEFSLSYKKLGYGDVDYILFNNKGATIAFVGVVIPDSGSVFEDTPLDVTLTLVSKLQDKRLSPILIWGFNDGIVFSKLMKLEGYVYCSKNQFGSDELVVRYDRQDSMKCLRRH